MKTLSRQSSTSRGQPRPARTTRSLELADVDSRERWIAIARAERSRYLAALYARLVRSVRASIATRRTPRTGSAHPA
jgi:hypothetical protein